MLDHFSFAMFLLLPGCALCLMGKPEFDQHGLGLETPINFRFAGFIRLQIQQDLAPMMWSSILNWHCQTLKFCHAATKWQATASSVMWQPYSCI